MEHEQEPTRKKKKEDQKKKKKQLVKQIRTKDLDPCQPDERFMGFASLPRETGWVYRGWLKKPLVASKLPGHPPLTDEYQRTCVKKMITKLVSKKEETGKTHAWLTILENAASGDGLDGWLPRADGFARLGIGPDQKNMIGHVKMFADPISPYVTVHRPQIIESRLRLVQDMNNPAYGETEKQVRVCPVHLEIYRQVV